MTGETTSLRPLSLLYSDALHISGLLGADGQDCVTAVPSDPELLPAPLCISASRETGWRRCGSLSQQPWFSHHQGRVGCGWAKLACPGTSDFFPGVFAALVGVERTGGSGDPCSSGSRANCFFFLRSLLRWHLSARRDPWRFLVALHKCAQHILWHVTL